MTEGEDTTIDHQQGNTIMTISLRAVRNALCFDNLQIRMHNPIRACAVGQRVVLVMGE